MLFYIAARYSKRHSLTTVINDLIDRGHECSSRWITAEQHETDADKLQWARNDLHDVRIADALIFFAETPEVGYITGGRHVEFGVAIEAGKPIYVIGEKENIFHWLTIVRHFATWNEFLESLADA